MGFVLCSIKIISERCRHHFCRSFKTALLLHPSLKHFRLKFILSELFTLGLIFWNWVLIKGWFIDLQLDLVTCPNVIMVSTLEQVVSFFLEFWIQIFFCFYHRTLCPQCGTYYCVNVQIYFWDTHQPLVTSVPVRV